MKTWIQTPLGTGVLSTQFGRSSVVDDDRQVMTVKKFHAGTHCTLKKLEVELVIASSPGTMKTKTAYNELTIFCKKDKLSLFVQRQRCILGAMEAVTG